jgi:hypothetical protein
MAAAKTTKALFDTLLGRDGKDINKETGSIIARSTKKAYESIVSDQVEKIDEFTIELQKMENINVSNNLMDAKRTDESSFDGKTWAKKYDDLTHKLFIAKQKVRVSDANLNKLFGYSYLEKEGLSFNDNLPG